MGLSQNIRIASKTNQIEEKEKEGNLNKRVVKLKHAEKESKAETKLTEEALLSFGLLKKMNASKVDFCTQNSIYYYVVFGPTLKLQPITKDLPEEGSIILYQTD